MIIITVGKRKLTLINFVIGKIFFLDKTLKSLYIDWFLTSSSNLILITFQTMIEHLLPCLIRPQIPQPPWWPTALFWPQPLQQPLRPQIILAAALIFKPKPPDSFYINWRPATLLTLLLKWTSENLLRPNPSWGFGPTKKYPQVPALARSWENGQWRLPTLNMHGR